MNTSPLLDVESWALFTSLSVAPADAARRMALDSPGMEEGVLRELFQALFLAYGPSGSQRADSGRVRDPSGHDRAYSGQPDRAAGPGGTPLDITLSRATQRQRVFMETYDHWIGELNASWLLGYVFDDF